MNNQHRHTQTQQIKKLTSYRNKLIGYIRAKAIHLTVDEGEDIAQEAITRVAVKIHQHQSPTEPLNYLHKVALNIVYDKMRRNKHELAHKESLMKIDAQNTEQTIEERQAQREKLACFEKELNRLPETTRQIMYMRKVQGKSNQEIAKIIGSSEKAVEKQINRAVIKLSQRLNKQGML